MLWGIVNDKLFEADIFLASAPKETSSAPLPGQWIGHLLVYVKLATVSNGVLASAPKAWCTTVYVVLAWLLQHGV